MHNESVDHQGGNGEVRSIEVPSVALVVEHRQRGLDRLGTFGAVVEHRAETADRQEGLGSEEEHEQRTLQVQSAVHDAQPDTDGDESN